MEKKGISEGLANLLQEKELNRVFRRFVNFKSFLLFYSITRYLAGGGVYGR